MLFRILPLVWILGFTITRFHPCSSNVLSNLLRYLKLLVKVIIMHGKGENPEGKRSLLAQLLFATQLGIFVWMKLQSDFKAYDIPLRWFKLFQDNLS